MIEVTTTNIIIEAINGNLHGANLDKVCILVFLLIEKQLEQQWRHAAQENEQAIKQVNKLNWEAYWQFLVKPHNQWMTLRYLTPSTQKMVPTLIDATFVGQLKYEIGQPPQLKPMTHICDLRDQVKRSQSFIYFLLVLFFHILGKVI